MRKTILALVLGVGILGIVGFTPSKANAYWLRTPYGYMNASGYGPYSSYYISGWPVYNTRYSFGGATGWSYNYPANYRYSMMNNYMLSLYASGGMRAFLYNPSAAAYSYRIVTPSYTGYMVSPYIGYKPISVPSSAYTIPLNNYYYYNGYLNPGFYNPYFAFPPY